MESVSYNAKPILNARDAVASHIRWKITMLTAARLKERLSERATQSIEDPQQCSIRRWLLSMRSGPIREKREYALALAKHIEFHRTMQTIARLLHSGQFAEAERRLVDHGGEFERASLELAQALMALDRAERHVMELQAITGRAG